MLACTTHKVLRYVKKRDVIRDAHNVLVRMPCANER